MLEENKKEVIDVNEVDEVIEEETKSKDSLVSKVFNVVKKNGKKVAVGAAIGAVGLIGYALGSKVHHDDDSNDDDVTVDVDLDYSNDVEESPSEE